jgi:hypothetical protein
MCRPRRIFALTYIMANRTQKPGNYKLLRIDHLGRCVDCAEKGGMVPVYHFHVFDGQSYPDEKGTELPDLENAGLEAIERTRSLLKARNGEVWDGRAWKMIVTDADQHSLFVLNFLVSSAPLTQEYGKRLSFDQTAA